MQSTTIVQLLRRLELPCKDLWKPGDGNQRLELVIRDYLEVFREIMRDPRWLKHFDQESTSRFAIVTVSKVGVATNRAAVF